MIILWYLVFGWSLGHFWTIKINFWTVSKKSKSMHDTNSNIERALPYEFSLPLWFSLQPHFDLGLCQEVIFFALAYSLKASFCIRNASKWVFFHSEVIHCISFFLEAFCNPPGLRLNYLYFPNYLLLSSCRHSLALLDGVLP